MARARLRCRAGVASVAAVLGVLLSQLGTPDLSRGRTGWAFESAHAEEAKARAPSGIGPAPSPLALDQVVQRNLYAFIPPHCYAKTVDATGKAHNSCHTCHVASRPPNFINDGELQLSVALVPAARVNPWSNLFVDFGTVGAPISNAEILHHVRQSNYFDERRQIRLAQRLSPPPEEWDREDDGRWSGFIPDAQFRFDATGFDRSATGAYTGWRVYAYYPLPGAFWPTNGSIGDALVRLPEAFRQNEAGKFDVDVYQLNLAIVEALILRRDVFIDATEERSLGVDLDRDGTLGVAQVVRFVAPAALRPSMSYVGQARLEQVAGRVHLAAGLFPEGTEFLHSLRYLDVTAAGVDMAARFKELRYARKAEWWTSERLERRAAAETEEKEDSPAEVRALGGDIERGVSNGQGWWYQGFIEDERGALRPQSFEETAYCVGCHGGVGRTDDGVFSFGRRLGPLTFQRGWFHWSDRSLRGAPDPTIYAGSATEYVTYLEENGAADELRQNHEAQSKFFDRDGRLKPSMKERLRRDIAELIMPSPERALLLNKAYWALVRTQRFSEGRDMSLGGAERAHRSVLPGEKTGVETPLAPGWHGERLAPVSAEP